MMIYTRTRGYELTEELDTYKRKHKEAELTNAGLCVDRDTALRELRRHQDSGYIAYMESVIKQKDDEFEQMQAVKTAMELRIKKQDEMLNEPSNGPVDPKPKKNFFTRFLDKWL